MTRSLGLILAIGMTFSAVGCWECNKEVKCECPDKDKYVMQEKIVFSFDPPADWKTTTLPDLKHKIVLGPIAPSFTPNIVVVDESSNATFSTYVKDQQTALKEKLRRSTEVKSEEFVTSGGIKGHKFIFENEQDDRELRQIFYIFPGRDSTNWVITCSDLAERKGEQDKHFDKAMKTFKLGKEKSKT